MDRSTCFNVTFDSNSCKSVFPDNKFSNFKIRLPRLLQLNDSWKVGLADVTFTNSRYTFDVPQAIRIQSNDKKLKIDFSVPAALYHDIAELIGVINGLINSKVNIEHKPQFYIQDGKVRRSQGYYKNLQGRLVPLTIMFSAALMQVLGLDRWGIPFLGARQPIIFVYCSVVKQRVVGDVSAKLLRTVDPSKGKSYGSTVSQVFRRIYFCSLDQTDIRDIEIQLLDDTGREPIFKFGAFRLTLQFKQNT